MTERLFRQVLWWAGCAVPIAAAYDAPDWVLWGLIGCGAVNAAWEVGILILGERGPA